MSEIEAQIALEKKMVAYGIGRYHRSIKEAESKGRESETGYSQALMREIIYPVAQNIEDFCKEKSPGVKAKYRTLLRMIDPNKAAYFGVKSVFNHFMLPKNIQQLGIEIGTMIEDELKFSLFQEQEEEYYNTIIDDFKRKGTKNYRHMHRVLTKKSIEKDVRWASWSLSDKVSIGVKVIDSILASTDLIEKVVLKSGKKTYIEIRPTESTKEWIKSYNSYAEMLKPDRMPCVIEPDDWTDFRQGGYYTPQLRKRTPLVKTKSAYQRELLSHDITNIISVVNIIQKTPWKINSRVYEVLKEVWSKSLPIGLPQSEPYEFPVSPVVGKAKKEFTPYDKLAFEEWKAEARIVHTMERERVSKCYQVSRIMRLADEYNTGDLFWYVWQCDFRGRLYCTTSGLSPQGPEYAKALLLFGNGVEIGKQGAYWLKVHGANCYGEDKISYSDRVAWTENNRDNIKAVSKDPMGTLDFWGGADKPWQFLAFCFEYSDYLKYGDKFLTHLPVGIDGACNGLQHFSAILRDPVGGKATNLIPSDKPSDIYAEVAKVCTDKVMEMHDDLGMRIKSWINTLENKTLPRNLVKKPVMTLPYGSTQQSCRESIYRFFVDEYPEIFSRGERFKVSRYLTPILWQSISEVVISARNAMDYIQACTSKITKENKFLIWWSPLGFPIVQDRKKFLLKRVQTQLAGTVKLVIGVDTETIDVRKNKLGSSPNFVHSMDACHLMMTCLIANDAGIADFSFVHDEYAVHAPFIPELHRTLREAFVSLYEDNDPLLDFKIFNEDSSGITLKDVPTKYDLKLSQVIDSKYFFN